MQVLDNPLVHHPGAGAREILRQPFPWRGGSQELYRPLTILSYRLNAPGGTPSGPAFHTLNVLLHLAAVLLVYALLRSLAGGSPTGRGAALFGAALFAVVPAHAEAVLWVSGRSEVAVGVVAAAALWIAARDLPGRPVRWGGMIGIGALLFIGLLFKESMLTLVPILFLLHLAVGSPGGGWRGRWSVSLARCAPLVVPMAVYVLLRWAALDSFLPDLIVAGKGAPLLARLGAAGRVMWEAVTRMLYLPAPSVEYWWPDAWRWTWKSVAGWGAALGGAAAALRARSAPTRWGIVVAGVGLLPYLHLVPFGEVFAERFLYLPSLGYALVACDAALHVGRLAHARWFAALGLVILSAYGAQTFAYGWVWEDDAHLWEYTYERAPDSPLAIHNLAKVRMDQGRFEAALALLARLRGRPDYDLLARRETVRVYGRAGRNGEGMALAAETLARYPDDPETLYLLGRHLAATGRRTDAERLAARLEGRAAADPAALDWGRRLRADLAVSPR